MVRERNAPLATASTCPFDMAVRPSLKFWSLSHALGMDSSEDCWKLEIFPLRALVLLVGKNLVRKAAEDFSHVSTTSLF